MERFFFLFLLHCDSHSLSSHLVRGQWHALSDCYVWPTPQGSGTLQFKVMYGQHPQASGTL